LSKPTAPSFEVMSGGANITNQEGKPTDLGNGSADYLKDSLSLEHTPAALNPFLAARLGMTAHEP